MRKESEGKHVRIPGYFVQNPRTGLYFRFNDDKTGVVADVPAKLVKQKASVFLEEHFVYLPADGIRTELDPGTRLAMALRKSTENRNRFLMKEVLSIAQSKRRARERKKKEERERKMKYALQKDKK